jgi:hypothetical protein
MGVDERLAADQLALDLVAASDLIAILWDGQANIYEQRRAARLLHEWMPRGMKGPPPHRASEILLERVEAAKANHGTFAAAYRALAAEEKPGASAESLAKRAENIERQHDKTKAAERKFADEARRKFFDDGPIILKQVDDAIAKHGSPAAACMALATKWYPGASAKLLARQAESIARRYEQANAERGCL